MSSNTIVMIPAKREPVTALFEVTTRIKYELMNHTRLTIGRANSSNIRIFEHTVSWHHCEIVLSDGVWWVEDKNSTNGTFVNDVLVSRAPLQPEMRLRLGRTEIHVLGRTSIITLRGKSVTSVYANAQIIYGSSRAAAIKLRRASRSKKGPSHQTIARARRRWAARIKEDEQ